MKKLILKIIFLEQRNNLVGISQAMAVYAHFFDESVRTNQKYQSHLLNNAAHVDGLDI